MDVDGKKDLKTEFKDINNINDIHSLYRCVEKEIENIFDACCLFYSEYRGINNKEMQEHLSELWASVDDIDEKKTYYLGYNVRNITQKFGNNKNENGSGNSGSGNSKNKRKKLPKLNKKERLSKLELSAFGIPVKILILVF